MSANKQTLTLIRKMSKFYKKERGWVYPDDEGKGGLWEQAYQRHIQEVMDNPDEYYMIASYFKEQSEWYLRYSQYALAHLADPALQKTAFAQSAWCGYQSACNGQVLSETFLATFP